MMKIITVFPRGFGANTYIITKDEKNAVVIDPSQPRIESELIKHGLTAKYVLLTHCHFDHVGGVGALQKSGAIVLCSEQEKPLVGTTSDLFDVFGAPRIPYTVNKTVADNEELDLCGMRVKMLLTPGHTKGSCCWLFTENKGGRYLFTGDTLFMDSIGRTDFPTGDMGELRKSLRKLKALDGDMPLFAGHNEETTLQRERLQNPFMIDV